MGNSSGAVVWREIASSPPPGFGRPTGRVGGTASGSERKSPAPGFGAARPSSTHSGGTKSATRTDMLVDGGIETGCDNLEVLRQRHDGNKYGVNSSSTKELPQKGLKRKFVVDATKGASPGGNASNTGKQLRSCRKGKGPGKCAKLKDNDGATRLGRVQTPIGVFEDECVFCHSFRTSEPCHGPMVLYHNRRIVPSDEDNPTNAVYVHEKCMVWAPEVESNGDTFKNVESEISRAKRLRCSRCKLQGAALGCYDNSCRKTYHVPCAMMIPECHWDVENFRVWCPKHAPRDEMSSPTMESDILPPVLQNQCPAKEISADCRMEDEHINPLPGDGTRSPIIENDITSAVLQNQCPAKETSVDCQMEDEHINPLPGDEMSSPIIESDIASTVLQNHSSQCPAKEISGDHQMKDEHINPLVTSNSSLPAQVPGQYLVNEGTSVVHRREDLQVDQPNTSSSSLPQGQCLDNEFFSANYRREEKLVNQSRTPVDQWVLLGIYLSASEKNKNGVNSSSTKELHQKGPKRKFAVDATKGASPGGNASNTEEQLRSCRKGKGPGKRAKLKDNDGSTGLGRVQTPIGVFEDECVFCHSFRTSEPCHGPMVLYHNRRIVPSDEGNPTNAVYVHEKCMVWAPEVESNGDTFKNVESEISRAKRLRCSRCKLRGAALGCYDESCRKTYHVPCAMMIPECRWDVENRRVWCPKHAPRDETSSPTMETLESDIVPPVLRNQCPAKEISVDCQMDDNQINPLPGDEMSSPITETDITSAVLQNQCPAKEISDDCQMEDEHINPLPGDEMSSPINETDITSAVFKTHSSQCPAKEISSDCQMEDEHINPLVTSNSSLPGQVPGQYSVQEGTSVGHRREDLQVDQLNTSSSSLPQGQCSDKERISASSRREEKPVNQSSTPVDQWVLLGIYLNASEKDSLKEFASLTSSILAEQWDQNVTHVIVGRNAGDTCGRSYEALMAILSGKWIVTAGWIVDCLVEPIPDLKTCLEKPIPGPEISYEVNFCDGSHTSGYGPMKGRARATERAPKLFSGLHFCLSAYIDPEDKETIRRLVAAGEGQVLEGISPDRLHENLNRNPAEVYFIYDSGPPRKITSDFDLILGKEIQESVEYAKSGAQVISHTRLLDAILCYDARILERRLHQDM